MVIVMNRFRVAPGREKDFEEVFRGRARLVETMPGFVSLEVLRPLQEQGVFVSMAHWETREAFEAWTKSEQFAEGHKNRHPGMFQGPPQFEMYEVFEQAEARSEG